MTVCLLHAVHHFHLCLHSPRIPVIVVHHHSHINMPPLSYLHTIQIFGFVMSSTVSYSQLSMSQWHINVIEMSDYVNLKHSSGVTNIVDSVMPAIYSGKHREEDMTSWERHGKSAADDEQDRLISDADMGTRDVRMRKGTCLEVDGNICDDSRRYQWASTTLGCRLARRITGRLRDHQ